jgi:hypothetical protein
MTRLLLVCGGDPEKLNHRRQTPLEVAEMLKAAVVFRLENGLQRLRL